MNEIKIFIRNCRLQNMFTTCYSDYWPRNGIGKEALEFRVKIPPMPQVMGAALTNHLCVSVLLHVQGKLLLIDFASEYKLETAPTSIVAYVTSKRCY